MRLLLRLDHDRVCSVPPQWTDVVASDPEIVIGRGRAVARVADLLELAELVARLMGQAGESKRRKANYAACVMKNMPRMASSNPHDATIKADMKRDGHSATLDGEARCGVIVDTQGRKKPGCRTDPSVKTRRQRRSSGRAR